MNEDERYLKFLQDSEDFLFLTKVLVSICIAQVVLFLLIYFF